MDNDISVGRFGIERIPAIALTVLADVIKNVVVLRSPVDQWLPGIRVRRNPVEELRLEIGEVLRETAVGFAVTFESDGDLRQLNPADGSIFRCADLLCSRVELLDHKGPHRTGAQCGLPRAADRRGPARRPVSADPSAPTALALCRTRWRVRYRSLASCSRRRALQIRSCSAFDGVSSPSRQSPALSCTSRAKNH